MELQTVWLREREIMLGHTMGREFCVRESSRSVLDAVDAGEDGTDNGEAARNAPRAAVNFSSNRLTTRTAVAPPCASTAVLRAPSSRTGRLRTVSRRSSSSMS